MANNSEVAHAWANKTGKQRRGSNLCYEDDTIYSYGHFPIARHTSGVVLFNGERYSSSTSRHQIHVLQACSHLTVFTVPHVRPTLGNTETMQRRNMDSYRKRIEEEVGKARRAITYTRIHIDGSEELAEEWKRYAKHFKLGRTYAEKLLIPEPERQFLMDKADERERIANERAAERYAACKRLADERRAKLEAEEAEKLNRWMAGEDVGRQFYTRRIRLRAKQGRVETSHGASVPYADGFNLWRVASARRREERWWKSSTDVCPIKIGDFTLSAINEQGIIVGCHRMDWQEVERLAETQGWSLPEMVSLNQ